MARAGTAFAKMLHAKRNTPQIFTEEITMAAKLTGYFVKVVCVVFTTIVAPIFVNVAVKDIKMETYLPRHKEPPSPWKVEEVAPRHSATVMAHQGNALLTSAVSSTKVEPAAALEVIVEGTGKTPQAALQDAFRIAISRAVAAEIGAEPSSTHAQIILGKVAQNSAAIICGWKEIGTSKGWRLQGILHHKQVAVALD